MLFLLLRGPGTPHRVCDRREKQVVGILLRKPLTYPFALGCQLPLLPHEVVLVSEPWSYESTHKPPTNNKKGTQGPLRPSKNQRIKNNVLQNPGKVDGTPQGECLSKFKSRTICVCMSRTQVSHVVMHLFQQLLWVQGSTRKHAPSSSGETATFQGKYETMFRFRKMHPVSTSFQGFRYTTWFLNICGKMYFIKGPKPVKPLASNSCGFLWTPQN